MRTFVRKFSFVFAGFLVLEVVNACGRSPQSSSNPAFAHGLPLEILGSPIGRLEALRLGYPTDFEAPLKLCIENGKSAIKDRELLLETKLGLAMWLNASGNGSTAFPQFVFESKSKCDVKDKSYAMHIVLVDFGREGLGGENMGEFNEPKITCRRSAGRASCSGSSLTLGWGSSGALGYRYYTNNPDEWTSLSARTPATVLLSPYVRWSSLSADILHNENLDAATKEALTESYEALLSQAAPGFTALVTFGEMLAQKTVKTGDDLGFDAAFRRFMNSKEMASSEAYVPEMASFHTLLHEIGHTFGIHHADNPSDSDVTGTSVGASKNAEGQWITETSVMAYSQPYAYLLGDDRLGAVSAAASVRKELARHKGKGE